MKRNKVILKTNVQNIEILAHNIKYLLNRMNTHKECNKYTDCKKLLIRMNDITNLLIDNMEIIDNKKEVVNNIIE